MLDVVDSFDHGVPWGVLRIEGVGAGSRPPELDIAFSMVSANESCVLVAVLHLDIDRVAITVARQGAPEGFVQMFSGGLEAPNGIIEVADVVGDDFSHRYTVSSKRVGVSVFADDPEEAAKVCIVVPDAVGKIAD